MKWDSVPRNHSGRRQWGLRCSVAHRPVPLPFTAALRRYLPTSAYFFVDPEFSFTIGTCFPHSGEKPLQSAFCSFLETENFLDLFFLLCGESGVRFLRACFRDEGVNRCYMEKVSTVQCIWEKLGASRLRVVEPGRVSGWGAAAGGQTLCNHPPKRSGPRPLCGEHSGKLRCAETWGQRWSVSLYTDAGVARSVLIRQTIILKSLYLFFDFLVAQATVWA